MLLLLIADFKGIEEDTVKRRFIWSNWELNIFGGAFTRLNVDESIPPSPKNDEGIAVGFFNLINSSIIVFFNLVYTLVRQAADKTRVYLVN